MLHYFPLDVPKSYNNMTSYLDGCLQAPESPSECRADVIRIVDAAVGPAATADTISDLARSILQAICGACQSRGARTRTGCR